jgi:hypothetical protein
MQNTRALTPLLVACRVAKCISAYPEWMPVLLRNQVYAGCVGLSAVGYAHIKKAEHFLAPNRMPLCLKMLCAKK